MFSVIVDLDALKKKPRKTVSSDEEEVDDDYNPYLDPEEKAENDAAADTNQVRIYIIWTTRRLANQSVYWEKILTRPC